MISRKLVHHPIDHALHGLGFHRTTGFADGCQPPPSPILRTDLLQRAQQPVHCHFAHTEACTKVRGIIRAFKNIFKRPLRLKTMKQMIQSLLKRIGFYQRLKSSYLYDVYWKICDRRKINDRSAEVAFYRRTLKEFKQG